MKNLMKIIPAISLIILTIHSVAFAWERLPQPEFAQLNFMRTVDVEEFNIDYALWWTDSAACLFVGPFDAVFLHVEVDGEPMDAIIISDIGMNRLTTWLYKAPGLTGIRELQAISAYYCEDNIRFNLPSGLATNAINRQFDPENDVVWVADRGNNRIVELRFTPDSEGGKLQFNRTIGEGYLDKPIDIAVSAYGDADILTADLYVVDLGFSEGEGELLRFDVHGNLEGSWHNVYYPGSPLVIGELHKPVSVNCYPDTIEGRTLIYVTEAEDDPLYQLSSTTEEEPEFRDVYDLKKATYYPRPGGIAFDDYGRVYVANPDVGIIQMFGPNMAYVYDSFGEQGEDPGHIYIPSNIIIDTYNEICEALIVEYYYRQSGLQTYFIDGGWSAIKPPLGFSGAGLPKFGSESSAHLPGRYVLGNAYPNPFNAQCIISFSIPKESRVKIDIFNILGQKVSTILDEEKEAGEYSVRFDASGLSSGVYFYRLVTNDYIRTKSMTLIK
ncbi:MAG: T9SS type A sorting domain-containing protein [Candidatus Zixiibacteriota bacterium]|nr:MAG: T9SS type A sorting domain-containing protein [candidate division Zixibacteria bacterium]